MQHLDEGRIQAWLDRERSGLDQAERRAIEEHLDSCPACAAMASELKQLDAQSALLLSRDPRRDDELPPFEAVVAKADATSGSDSTRRAPRAAFAWAASIAVALGTGWFLNDALGPGAGSVATRGPAATVSKTATSEPTRIADQEPAASRRRDAGQSGRETMAGAAELESAAAEAPTAPPREFASAGGEEVLEAMPSPPAQALVAAASGLDTVLRTEEHAESLAADAAGATPERPRRDAAMNVADAAAVPEASVVHGRVTDPTGTPLPGAQVYIPGTSIGALSGPDGRFTIALGESAAAFGSDPLTLMVELVGYGSVTRAVGSEEAVSFSVEIEMAEQALSLDQIVVTGQARAPAADRQTAVRQRALEERPPSSFSPADLGILGSWTESTRAEAEARAGFTLATLADQPIGRIWLTAEDDPVSVSIEQRLDDGTGIILVETRRSAEVAVTSEAGGVASTVRDGVTIVLVGELPVERLESLLRQVR